MRPQAHCSPSGSTTTWPISPAAARWPCSSAPSRTRPGTDAGPDPEQHQAAVARRRRTCARRGRRCWRRWRRRRGRPSSRCRVRPSGVSVQPRLGASTTVPSASTTPGLPTPTPRTGRSVQRDQARGPARAPGRPRRLALAAGDGELVAGHHLAGQVDHGADHPVVGREVEADDVGGVGGEADQHRRLAHPALRPVRRAPRPGPRPPARRPGRRRSPGSGRWCGRGRRGSPVRAGTAAGAAVPGGGVGCPPAAACRWGGAGGQPERASSHLLVQRTY